ncbi:MAG: lysylphosphatidylglycerol synthase transmembrane domain-containing protein [Pseudomonadota bacterium]
MKTSRQRFFKAVRAVVSVALVLFAFYVAGLFDSDSRSRILTTIRDANLAFLILSILWIPLMDVVSTIKWKSLCNARGISVRYFRLLAFYIVGRFYNLILPSSIGGDLIRIYLLGQASQRNADAAAVVFVERLTGVIVLLVLSAVSLLFTGLGFSRATLAVGIIAAGAGIAALCWLLIGDMPLNLLRGVAKTSSGLFGKVLEKLAKLQVAVRAFKHHGGALFIAIANSLLFYMFAILNVWVSVLVFQGDVSLISMVIAVPLIMFIMNIPVSLGSLGIMEFGYTVVLMQFGVNADAAFATALLMRMKLLLAGAFGAVVYAALGESRPDPQKVAASV